MAKALKLKTNTVGKLTKEVETLVSDNKETKVNDEINVKAKTLNMYR